jgi:alpha-1,3-rhamnosyltransferase
MNSKQEIDPNEEAKPIISVVVPSYNHAQFIEKCLRSIFKQTIPPSKLIVIDDGSKDSSVEIIERALKSCPFPCELIARENKGLCASLNEGFSLSGGEYFAYIGSDDLWSPRFIEERIKLLKGRPKALLGYGHAYIIDEMDQITDCTNNWARYVDGNVQRMLLSDIGPISSSVLYRRGALEKYRWNELSRLEDYEIYLRLSIDGEFAFDPQVLSAWRVHKSNTSRNTEMFIEEIIKAQDKVKDDFNFSVEEFAEIQARLKFRCAEHYIKNGMKLKAINLIKDDLNRVPSFKALARIAIGIITPIKAQRRLKEFLQNRKAKEYGQIEERMNL